MTAHLDQFSFEFRPTSYTVNETKTLFEVRDTPLRIISCDVRVETAFNGLPTCEIGITTNTSAIASVADVTMTAAGLYAFDVDLLADKGAKFCVKHIAHASTTAGIMRLVFTGYRVGV